MKLLLVSDSVIWDSRSAAPYPDAANAIAETIAQGNDVFLVSAHKEPGWLKTEFPDVLFQGCQHRERMNGGIVHEIVAANSTTGLKISDVVVLGAKDNDLTMAVQSKTLLLRCEWCHDLGASVKKYGLPLRDPKSIPLLVSLLKDDAPWFFKHKSDSFEAYALTDAGTYGETDSEVLKLKERLKNCLKDGKLLLRDEFTAHFMSSMCATDVFREIDVWGWYPSSKAGKQDSEVMGHFCTLARTTFGRRTKGPLFIRHADTIKRSGFSGERRTDPTTEIESIHINPAYNRSIEGKSVAVLDDFLTHGLSLGVAASLLKQAGAAKIVGVAMGRFGSTSRTYKLRLNTDQVYAAGLSVANATHQGMTGTRHSDAQTDFVQKFRNLL